MRREGRRRLRDGTTTEQVRMGTDTDCVHPTIVPVEGVCGGSTTGDATMEQQHNADGRDDCRVPWIRTYSPERARMGTDTDCVHPTIVHVKGVCGAQMGTDTVRLYPQLFLSKEIQPKGRDLAMFADQR